MQIQQIPIDPRRINIAVNDNATSRLVRTAFRHTHHIMHSLPAPSDYKDSFLCTPPDHATEDPYRLEAWAEAEVIKRRGDHGWNVKIISVR